MAGTIVVLGDRFVTTGMLMASGMYDAGAVSGDRAMMTDLVTGLLAIVLKDATGSDHHRAFARHASTHAKQIGGAASLPVSSAACAASAANSAFKTL